MKRCLVILLLLLSSCRNIYYDDINPKIHPNEHKLPAMKPLTDISNLKSVYSSRRYEDSRVNDTINIFNKEVKENITDPYGKKKGYISLKLGYRGNKNEPFLLVPFIFSFGLSLFAGIPTDIRTQSLEVEVEILNNKKELIKRYSANVEDTEFEAMYYGYRRNTIYRKLAADNIKQAMEQIRLQINNDAAEIIEKLQ